MIAHPKVLLVGGAFASSGLAMISQALPVTTPGQIAMVLAGLAAIGVGIGTVITGYLWVHNWMKRTAKEEAANHFAAKETQEAIQRTARGEVKGALEDHSKEAAQRTRSAVQEAITAAGKEQAAALKEHIADEKLTLMTMKHEFSEGITAIKSELTYQRNQNSQIIDIAEYLKAGSSPSIKKLASSTELSSVK
jgi:hypothetical protein